MTTIAITKSSMAADTQVTLHDITFNSPKIFKFHSPRYNKEIIAGAAGDASGCVRFIDWLMDKYDMDDEDMSEVAGIICTGDKILYYDFCTTPMEITDDHFAIGVGSQAALAILDTGGNIEDAVKAAILRNPDTGGKITILELL